MADNQNSEQKQVIVSIQADNSSLNEAIDSSKQKLQELGTTPIPTDSIKSFRQELKEAQDAALALQQAGKINTQDYADAVKKVADLRDHYQKLNSTVSAFDPGNKLSAFVGIAQGATTAVQGYAGAMQFLGVSSDDSLKAIQKLQGIMAFSDALGGIDSLKDSFKALTIMIKGMIPATEGASVATKGLGIALDAIGIGLITAAIAYLIANWDNLKKTIEQFIPQLSGMGDTFNKIKAIVVGVGSAVVTYLVSPIKAFIDVIHGDFKQAFNDIAQAGKIVQNFKQGYQQEELNQQKAHDQKLAAEQVKTLTNQLALQKEGSKQYIAIQNQLADAKIAAATTDDARNKAVQEKAVIYAQRRFKEEDAIAQKAKAAHEKALQDAKALRDKYNQDRKQAFDDITKYIDDSNKALSQSDLTQKQKDLDDAKTQYQLQLQEAEKFHLDKVAIQTAYTEQIEAINQKYESITDKALKDRESKDADSFTQKKKEINDFYDNLLTTASDKQKQLIEAQRKAELTTVNQEQNLSSTNDKAQANLTSVTGSNQSNPSDSLAQAKQKIENITSAQIEAEDAAFALKKAQAIAQNGDLESLEATHQANLIKIQKDANAQIKANDKAVSDFRVATYGKIGDALGALSDVAGKNTVAGKALAIAQATINTYTAATQILAAETPPLVPPPVALALKIASMVAVIATGLEQVKQIASVKVDAAGDSSATGSISAPRVDLSNVSAPVVTASNDTSNQIQNVRITNPQDTQPIRAYITDKDLKDSQDRTTLYNKLSTF